MRGWCDCRCKKLGTLVYNLATDDIISQTEQFARELSIRARSKVGVVMARVAQISPVLPGLPRVSVRRWQPWRSWLAHTPPSLWGKGPRAPRAPIRARSASTSASATSSAARSKSASTRQHAATSYSGSSPFVRHRLKQSETPSLVVAACHPGAASGCNFHTARLRYWYIRIQPDAKPPRHSSAKGPSPILTAH